MSDIRQKIYHNVALLAYRLFLLLMDAAVFVTIVLLIKASSWLVDDRLSIMGVGMREILDFAQVILFLAFSLTAAAKLLYGLSSDQRDP